MEKCKPCRFITQKNKDIYTSYVNLVKPITKNKFGDIQVIDTPYRFHSFGMNMFLFKNMLFAGDMIMCKDNKLCVIAPECNLDHDIYLKHLKEFDIGEINYICQAHGDPMPINEN
jgi:hypothetical protein